jgi:SHAQKYF class myb-like DNA-binding protein
VFEAAFAAACNTKVIRFEHSRRARGNPPEFTLERVFGTTDVDAINRLSEEEFLRLKRIAVNALPEVAKRESELAERRAERDAARAARAKRESELASMPKATGGWTAEEHDEFLKCLDLYGHNWTKAAERITTRTRFQIRSHAQKHFKKVQAAGETVSPPQAKAAKPKKRKGAKGAAPPAKKPKK